MNGIREMRIKCGLRKKEVALQIGADPKLLSAWEHGKGIPPAKKLLEMAKLFDCKVYDISEGIGVPHTYMTPLGELRRSKGLTQLDVAEALGVNIYTVSNWETCKSQISSGNMQKLANLYGVMPEEIRKLNTERKEVCVDLPPRRKRD